ncbi:hypothetical protein C8J57DRAFT_1079546 [Mycena rebaudengoi]|nr:hypothetical protein C8J57DRAFT_1079546 [Mycena rebaudengoi]
MSGASDQDIYDAVTEKFANEQLLEVAGGDDNDIAEVIPRPTRRQALEAVPTIHGYISDRGDDFARQMEVILADFGRQTRLDDAKAMRETQMTDYFSRIASTQRCK